MDVMKSKQIIQSIFIIMLYITAVSSSTTRLDEIYVWKELDYNFPNADVRKRAIETEQYIPGSGVITGFEIYMERIFVCVPRMKRGVPSTLNYILLEDTVESTPKLQPFPSLEENMKELQTFTSSILVSIFRVTADSCGRLWAIDSGIREMLSDSPIQEISPTIHVFDLRINQLIFSYSLKPRHDYIEGESFFPNIVVDVTSGNCDDAFVYLPDVGSPAIVVYNIRENNTHRLKHNYFHFDPIAGDFYLANKKHYQLQDGIISLSLSPIDKDDFRTVYFHPLVSTKEFTVSTKILQNKTLSENYLESFRILGDRGINTQSGVSVLDEETGVIFYTQIVKNSVTCWNSFKGEDYSPATIGLIADHLTTMASPSDIKIDKKGYLWILTNKLPEFKFSNLNSNDVNIIIYKSLIRKSIKGTVCD